MIHFFVLYDLKGVLYLLQPATKKTKPKQKTTFDLLGEGKKGLAFSFFLSFLLAMLLKTLSSGQGKRGV